MLQPSRLVLCLCLWSILTFSAEADLAGFTLAEVGQLARQGEPEAQLELALRYQFGEGLKADPQEAVNWYCRAAYQGSVAAQRNLGSMLFKDGKKAPDLAGARYWFERAAAQGDEYARRMLEQLADTKTDKHNGCTYVAHPQWLAERCRRRNCQQIIAAVERLAPEFGLDSNLVLSVIEVESSFRMRVCSGKNACGLMQLTPVAAKRFGVRDLGDLEQNLRGGMAYLRWLLAYFQGDLRYALAGYNAGEGAVVKHRGIPPYPETRAYVDRIIGKYGKVRHSYRKDWIRPSRIMVPSVAQAATDRVADLL